MLINYPCDHQNAFLHAELRRDHSMSERGFAHFMFAVSSISLFVGSVLYFSGAWPVVGFIGLDVALIYIAFKSYQRSQRLQYDRIVLGPDELVIEQLKGKKSVRQQIEPTFAQCLIDHEQPHQPLMICQKGQCYEIGRWLGEQEKEAFMVQFKRAMEARLKALPHLPS